jgi:hypothetical protein
VKDGSYLPETRTTRKFSKPQKDELGKVKLEKEP